jgi:hypothetical protein
MFINESGQNVQSLERTFHKCFLPSFGSFGWGVSEKIKMWKVNGQRMMDAKWWQKLTLPLARRAKKIKVVFDWKTFAPLPHFDEIFYVKKGKNYFKKGLIKFL